VRVSYEWLSDFVDLSGVTPQQAAELLTMAGVEISSVTVIDLSQIVVGRVLEQEKHPHSRNDLWIHKVDVGRERPIQIIAGRPNAGPGALAPVAFPGTTVPNGHLVREGLVIAGVKGEGMLCSGDELLLPDGVDGIMVLQEGRPGQSMAELFPTEAILEAEVNSNRPDCLAHFGVARELAAALDRPLKRDFMPPFTGDAEPPGVELAKIEIEAPDLCRRYIGGVISDVKLAPSPGWMQRRLRAGGLRPINNVVDVTNYVLLEYGQPLHAFDLARVGGRRIRVRRATSGERLTTLDGEERELTPEMLVIADADVATAIAGVIGGSDSEVTESTTQVLLEAATFDGPSVRATARALGVRTEASTRFEKGLSPELALAGARRAAALLAEVTGGRVHREWADVYPRPQEPVRVAIQPGQIDAVLGVHVPIEESEAILRRLGFHVRVQEDGAWDVLPPVFRLDVSIPEDVVEEVGRIHGYDKVPATLPGARHSTWRRYEPSSDARLDVVREILAGAAYWESVTPALVPHRLLQDLGLAGSALEIANPMSDEMDALRTSLLPSLLQAAELNRNRGQAEPRLYELAAVYLRSHEDPDGLPSEPRLLGVVRLADGGSEAGRKAALEVRALLDRCADELGTPALAYARGQSTLFHPGRCASVSVDGRVIGHVGELHPLVLRRFDLDGRVAAAEIDVAPLLERAAPRKAQPLPRFPAVERDLAVVLADHVTAAELLTAIRSAAGPLLASLTAFDEYRGEQVPEGSKSVAVALTFRSPERTLTDAEVDGLMDGIRSKLTETYGAGFRT
jgi:phenylalanyl-tRNA synthetase beta chain